MGRKIYDFRPRYKMKRTINLMDYDTGDLYFKIGEYKLGLSQETFITVSLSKAAKVGDDLNCEFMIYEVIRVEEERPHERRKGKGFIFQKLIVKRVF